ncbi:MAG: PD-(D/E)XK nuclease family protein, partial [Woeseiaceae bacterium]
RLFAAIAGRYLGILEREHWVDDAGLGALVDGLLRSRRAVVEGRATFVGFDRERPLVRSIKEALLASGCEVCSAPTREIAHPVGLHCFDTVEMEMRAAGAWARARLEDAPGQSIAIIAGNLEQSAERMTHLVREGLVPGWQYGSASVAAGVNVSYGRKLIEFPAISIALLWLTWLVRDLSTTEIGHLLRTPLLADGSLGARSRLELKLRKMPDRDWSPTMISSALSGLESGSGDIEWLSRVAELTKSRRELRRRASPAQWAVYIDAVLSACGWPGTGSLSSFDFQLVNRWRDALNDLARLDLVSPTMDLKGAIRRLEQIAAEAIFQPESDPGAVQLMGPLEASGAEFDAVWISGLSAASWPPSGNPSPLLSRQLQRQKGMPDAEPADTVDYAQRLLCMLGSSAVHVLCSYALHEDDTEQAPSGLLAALDAQSISAEVDPGWHAANLANEIRTVRIAESAPQMHESEQISGGAGALQRQLNDPISAFIVARLGVAYLPPQAIGLPAPLRGNIIHDVLHQLYIDTPSQQEIGSWTENQLQMRIDNAVNAAFSRHERNTDDVLNQLLRLERVRVAGLLRQFVTMDVSREDFNIAAVEHPISFQEASVRLQLRIDRLDRRSDDTVVILDYKTGARKTLLGSDGRPKEIQLIVYAMALKAAISAVALVNIDSREMGFTGAGEGYTDATTWEASLDQWKLLVRGACRDLSDGDVRINVLQGPKEARPFNLLSRYTELLRVK